MRGNEEAGKYRTIQNYVDDMFNIKFTPCSPIEVPDKMKSYIFDLECGLKENQKYVEENHWLSLFHNLAKHHIEFEKIHPFTDGNGRCGRLLLTYEMISIGLLPVDIRYEERSRYYSALSAYDDKAKYSTRKEIKTENMAKIIAESELRSMNAWLKTFNYELGDGNKENDQDFEM